MRKYGLIKDKKDSRDHIYEPRVGLLAIPSHVDMRHMFSQVENQGDLGSCTSNSAVGGAFEFLQLKEIAAMTPLSAVFGPTFTNCSRLFHYYNERELMGTENEDSGASIRDSVKVLATKGVCAETMWPYKVARYKDKPPPRCYTQAIAHRISQYARCTSITSIRNAIANGFPVLIGIDIYESFETEAVAKSGMVPMPAPGEELLGGHALCIAGYDDATQKFIVRNSWGSAWGAAGYCYIPYTYLTKHGSDFWTISK